MREIEKIIMYHPKYDKRYIDNTEIINMLKNSYNLGLQDAADNAKVITSTVFGYSIIDRESILKLKL